MYCTLQSEYKLSKWRTDSSTVNIVLIFQESVVHFFCPSTARYNPSLRSQSGGRSSSASPPGPSSRPYSPWSPTFCMTGSTWPLLSPLPHLHFSSSGCTYNFDIAIINCLRIQRSESASSVVKVKLALISIGLRGSYFFIAFELDKSRL